MGAVRHIRKFARGQMTPQEYHSKYAFPIHAKCAGCSSNRPITRAIVMMELDEAKKRNPLIEAMMLLDPMSFMQQIVQIRQSDNKTKPYFRCSIVYACKTCTPALEKQLAKSPSHCIVELNHGPDKNNRIVG